MEGDSSSAIDSSSDNITMDQSDSSASTNNLCSDGGSGGAGAALAHQRISSSGADEESETDELTIDDSCVNNDDNEGEEMDDENDNNVAIVSSSTLHQLHEDEEDEDGCAASSGYMSSEPEAVAVTSNPVQGSDEETTKRKDNAEKNVSQQSAVSTTTSEAVPTPEIKITGSTDEPKDTVQHVAKISKGTEEDDVDIDGMEDTPASPIGPESPSEDSNLPICSPDIASPASEPKVNESPPQSPEFTSTPDTHAEPTQVTSLNTETILSQENFSQFNTSGMTLSTITSDSTFGGTQSSSQVSDCSKTDKEEPMDDDTVDTSQIESSQAEDTQSPPIDDNTSEMENDESQQSVINTSEKSVPSSNGAVPKTRTKSRSQSRSNTEDADGDDVDLEDGEIMDDEEEEVKIIPPPPKEKKEKEKIVKPPTGSSTKDRTSEKEKERAREKEKEREKEKHRREKKRLKQEEEKKKEKEKEVISNKKKKRKASEGGESEADEFSQVRGISPGSVAPPPDSWNTPVEEFGDDSKVSRAKRRRESDGEDSHPHHHHHPNRQTREPTPPGLGRRMDRNKRPMREERKEPKSDVICAYFMQGKCQKSSIDCTFSHDAVPPRKMELCKFWMMECCAKKEKCLYLHNDFPCKYYHTGLICKAGDRCKFSHSPLSDVTKQVLLKHIETAPKEILGDFPRLNRQGAINLINKMEARLRGERFDDDKDGYPEIGPNDLQPHHGRGGPMQPQHDRHHHGRNDERHNMRNNREHHNNHGHGHGHGPGPGHHGHMNQNQQRGNNDMNMRGSRGAPDPHHNNNRNSRWEQQQPTRDDQEKLQELMEEAGISGYYKDTMENNAQPPVSQPPPGPPGPFPSMQPGLLPLNPVLMSQMLPGLIPHTQPNAANNPALANVLATLNHMPNSAIVPTTLASMSQLNPGVLNASNVPSLSTSQASDESSDKSIPDHLPKMQQELFMRIQKQQQKNEKKMQNFDKPEPEEPEENWYSSEDEDDSKKKEDSKVSDKISSVLNQIRQQSRPQSSPSPILPSSLPLPPLSESKPPSYYGDTDFRSQPPTYKDVDLRNPSSIFKKIDIEPAKEINASLAHNGPIPYKVRKVGGVPKIDYSSIRMGMPPSSIVLDPRLGPQRNNSIPAPASPTETSTPDTGIQPLTIPDGTPVFDPRTMRGCGPGPSSSGRNPPAPTITPQQNNPFLDSDNRFGSLPNPGLNDFPPMFNRDPRGGGGSGNQPGGAQAQNLAAMAAAMAAMQQQLPNMQNPMDPNLLMLGFPFLPQQPGGGVQNPMDFQQMLAASGAGNLRMRPPFPPQQPASSSWERLNQSQQGQGGGDLTPPL